MDYGPFLESVNGLAGNATEHTYWQVLARTMDGKIMPTDVGESLSPSASLCDRQAHTSTFWGILFFSSSDKAGNKLQKQIMTKIITFTKTGH